MMSVNFYDSVDDKLLKFAVIVSKSNGKWVFCKHKKRTTYEIPGGYREPGEDIVETARRELVEETGAIDFDLKPICVYSVIDEKILTVRKHSDFFVMPKFLHSVKSTVRLKKLLCLMICRIIGLIQTFNRI